MRQLQTTRLWFVSVTAIFVGAFEYLRHYPFHEFLEELFPGWQENFFSVLFLMAGVMLIANHIFIRLKRVSESLSKIITTSPDVIIFIENNHDIKLINPVGEELLEIKDLKALKCYDVLSCTDENKQKLCDTNMCPVRITQSYQDQIKTLETYIKGKQDREIPVEISFARLKENGDNRGSLFIIRDIRDRKKKEALEKQRISERAIAEERFRLAREIHDGLAQGLSYLKMRLHLLLTKCNQYGFSETEQDIMELKNLIDDLYQETRLAITNLNSTKLITGGLSQYIEKYLENYTKQNGISIQLNWTYNSIINNIETEMHVLRIIQEALNNIRRHSKASKAKVTLKESEDHWCLEISDNGIGFNPQLINTEKHFGINNMRDRAEMIKADFTLISNQEGTKIKIKIPRQQQEGELNGEKTKNIVGR